MDMDTNTSIFCDCSDCGNKRVTGKCLLEEYYFNVNKRLLPEIRRRNMINIKNFTEKKTYLTILRVTEF